MASTPTPVVDETTEAPDLDLILTQAKTKAELQDALRMMHQRNRRLMAVRDQISHELYQARAQLLSDRSR